MRIASALPVVLAALSSHASAQGVQALSGNMRVAELGVYFGNGNPCVPGPAIYADDQPVVLFPNGTTQSGPGGTGNRVRVSGFEEWILATDGLIAESQGHFDQAEYERQLEYGGRGVSIGNREEACRR